MVTRAGFVKICDFGIAKAPLDSTEACLTGPMYAMGTGKFMAPEQPGGLIDARTDLYALGCTIYAMLTGDPPFDGRDAAEILQKHRDQPPVPLREHRVDVGAALESLVSQLLAKRPDSRPGSAAEVKARLEATQNHPDTIAAERPAQPAITVRMPAVSPGVSSPGRSAHRVWAHAAVPRGDERHLRRIVSRGLAAAGTLVVVTTVAVLLAAASRPASVQPEVLGTEGAPTVVTPVSLTATMEVTSTPQISAPPTPMQPTRAPSTGTIVPVSSSAPPVDPIANFRLSIQEQVNTGQLNPTKAGDLYTKVDGIAQSINAGKFDDVRHKVQDFRTFLTSLRNAGQLTPAGYDALASNLDAIPLA
jgi:serine/threonine-protein kinase